MRTVLIVDDDKTLRQLVYQVLELLELDILEAGDAKEAIKVLDSRDGKVDLILLDVFMPEVDGIEFLKQLKANPEYDRIPIVMLTAAADKMKMLDAIRSGAKHYITKPFNSEDLLTRVIQVLGLDMI